jgi:hypothetical protein
LDPLIEPGLAVQTNGATSDFMFEFAEFSMALGGIPFFNQTKNATPQCVSQRYGRRLALFKKVREEFDPMDRLLNQYFANYLAYDQ